MWKLGGDLERKNVDNYSTDLSTGSAKPLWIISDPDKWSSIVLTRIYFWNYDLKSFIKKNFFRLL